MQIIDRDGKSGIEFAQSGPMDISLGGPGIRMWMPSGSTISDSSYWQTAMTDYWDTVMTALWGTAMTEEI